MRTARAPRNVLSQRLVGPNSAAMARTAGAIDDDGHVAWTRSADVPRRHADLHGDVQRHRYRHRHRSRERAWLTITGVAAGMATVTVTATDGNRGAYAMQTIAVTVQRRRLS